MKAIELLQILIDKKNNISDHEPINDVTNGKLLILDEIIGYLKELEVE